MPLLKGGPQPTRPQPSPRTAARDALVGVDLAPRRAYTLPMAIYRYSQWDGSQDVALPSADDLFDRLSEQILQGDDLRGALNRMMRHGMRGEGQRGAGLQELLERLREARERNLDRYNLSSMFDGVQERLDEIVKKEREGIAERLREIEPPGEGPGEGGRPGAQSGGAPPDDLADMLRKMANRRLEQLDALPPGPGLE